MTAKVIIIFCSIILSVCSASVLKIGTRGSPLALAQAYETKRLLGIHFPELAVEGAVEIQKIMTIVSASCYLNCCFKYFIRVIVY